MRNDTQRLTRYRAENEAFGTPDSQPEISLECCQRLVKIIFEKFVGREGFVKARKHPPKVKAVSGRTAAATAREMLLPPFAQRGWIVCHEMAHALAPPGGRYRHSHGW